MKKNKTQSILTLDIGGGTQDLLVWSEGESLENSLQCILPSPTIMIGRRIQRATQEGKPIFLTGYLMGGGSSSEAVRNHLKAGCPVFARPQAALTIHDDLDQVTRMGIQFIEAAPPGAVEIKTGDIQEEALVGLFESFDLDLPEVRLVAVQDHGFAPRESNRRFRFKQWEVFLSSEKPLEALLYQDIPAHLTRMRAVQQTWPQALVMDTGAAAILGALEDDRLSEDDASSRLIVNIGNEHTLAAWMIEGQLKGIFEHHTFFMQKEKLMAQLQDFVSGRLSNEQVLEEKGHGCLNLAPWSGRFPLLIVTGPRRGILAGTQALKAAPFGNMMLSGCFGLLRAYGYIKNRLEEKKPLP
ncbi:MAG: DUF1786 domain-containing protein [Thermodesulfobacteriota bacterium]